MTTSPPPAAEPKKMKQDPVIPYIDDAFGSVDAELGYGRPAEKKRPEEGGGKG